MALLFWEGFDFYPSLNDLVTAKPEVAPGYMVGFGSYPNYQSSEGRFGRYSIGGGYWVYWGKIDVVSYNATELYTGRAIKHPVNNGLICFWGNNGGGTNQPDIWSYVDNGTVYVYRYNSSGTNILLGQSEARIFKYNIWNWIEMRCKLSTDNASTDGIVEFWLNGNRIINLTNVTTKRSNTTTCFQGVNFQSGINTNGGEWRVDDIYITDTTGPAPWNGRLGDLRIVTVSPNYDVGANSGTPSTGNTHWGVIDERPYNTSDYLTIPNTPGNKETFYINNIPTIANSIFAVSVMSVQQKSDAGTCNTHTFLTSNNSGYTSNSNTIQLTTTYSGWVDYYITNPETGNSWSYSEISNTQIGLEIDP